MTAPRRLLAAATVAAALLACAGRGGAEPAAARPQVVIETADGARHVVAVELARTDRERERGLMYRTSLPEGSGMLFIFQENERRAFWMMNTLIPLDMIFIDDGGRVAAVIAEAAPRTITPRDPGVASRYVLEVNGGWAARHGVRPGDRVRFEGVPLS
jgi:uncharacterized membrane protein (UPF0127 family)